MEERGDAGWAESSSFGSCALRGGRDPEREWITAALHYDLLDVYMQTLLMQQRQ